MGKELDDMKKPKERANDEHPNQLIVGLPPHHQVYQRVRGHFMLLFDEEMSSEDIQGFIGRLELREYHCGPKSDVGYPFGLRSTNARWIVVAQEDQTPGLARRLLEDEADGP